MHENSHDLQLQLRAGYVEHLVSVYHLVRACNGECHGVSGDASTMHNKIIQTAAAALCCRTPMTCIQLQLQLTTYTVLIKDHPLKFPDYLHMRQLMTFAIGHDMCVFFDTMI